MKDVVEQAIANADHQSEALFALSNSTKILFSEKVAITEGKTEKIIFPAVFENLFGVSPGEDKIGIVEIGGVNNIPDTMRVLRAMGLPCKAIADLDLVFRTAPAKGLIAADHEDLAACREIFRRLEAEGHVGLDEAGLPRKHNGNPAIVAFELLAADVGAQPHIDRLFDAMLDYDIWLWKKGAIETYLDIAKTDAARMTFISRLPDRAYRDALPDYTTIVDAMAWLRG